jgi:hypothetical protein
MSDDVDRRLGEIEAKLDALTEELHTQRRLLDEIHGAWCLEVERTNRVLPEKTASAVGPGSRVSWTDPKDESNVAWGGTVEFVGVDAEGTAIAHVDFAAYGRRNLPVDELIIGILT